MNNSSVAEGTIDDSREIWLTPGRSEKAEQRPFSEVSKRWLLGSAVRIGLENFFKNIIQNVKSYLGPNI